MILQDNLIDAHPGVGCISNSSIAKVPGGLMFLSNDGVQVTNTAILDKVSDGVKKWLDTIAETYKDVACSLYDGKFYRVSYATGSNDLPNETLCLDIKNGGWSVLDYGMNAYVKTRTGYIYAAGQDGYVYTMDTGLDYDGSTIMMKATTKIFNFNAPQRIDIFRKAGIETKGSTDSLKVAFSVDRGAATFEHDLEFAGGSSFWGDLWAISTGTVTVTNGSATVTGDASTSWALVAVGDSFQVDGDTTVYTVLTVNSVTKVITLTSNYSGTGGANKEYAVWNADYMLWTEPLASHIMFSLPKRLKGRSIQVQFRDEELLSDIAIYGLHLGYLPTMSRR